MTGHRLAVLLLLLSSSFVFAQPQAPDKNPDLALGMQAYKNGKYEEAVQHFERAVAGEPESVQAHRYLANAYAQQYIPGSDEVSNVQLGNAAVREYKRVLELDSKNLDAAKGLAQVFFNMKELDQAIEAYRTAIEIDPKDPEPYYSIAVIDWTLTYQPRMEQRAKLGLRTEQPLIFAAACGMVRQANWERIADGMEMLKKAIGLRRDYDDAMAYMNLMYRERADVQCNDASARASDLKAADDWVDMTLAVKQRKARPEQSTDKTEITFTEPSQQ
jgi:tetratricopeptide (TPR) repeat protein